MLYNKYRPVNLDMILGQDHVKRILKNQVKKKELSHAYLFTGPAGTGKTTVARILSSMVNDSSGITVDPDQNDENIKNIFLGKSLIDVFEIDAASNNGVDAAREICDKSKFPPMNMRYKIWIIDECHRMTQAWEVLLKVIEEPPSYTMFIFCTTDDSKIPETIKTRCTTFRFNSIMSSDIYNNLSDIANKEKITISEEIIKMISCAARGSMRMALNYLEQLSSIEDLTPVIVTSILGIPNRTNATEFIHSLIETPRPNATKAIKSSSQSICNGVLIENFMSCIAELCHDLSLCQSSTFDMESYGYSKEEVKNLKQLRESIDKRTGNSSNSVQLILRWINTINNMSKFVVYHTNPQYQANIMWITMCYDLKQHIISNNNQ